MSQFTIRIYGIVCNQAEILLSREQIGESLYVKFPGGGLEFGEGTRSCLQRELKEETGLYARIGAHVYTTDFFQPSTFHDIPTQVLSIYYFAELEKPHKLKTVSPKANLPGFYWIRRDVLSEFDLDLPIDKKVVEIISRE